VLSCRHATCCDVFFVLRATRWVLRARACRTST
jgi:hypothetical protein